MVMIGKAYTYKGFEITQYCQGTLLGGAPGFNSMIRKDGENIAKCCENMHQWGSFSDVCAERYINTNEGNDDTDMMGRPYQPSVGDFFAQMKRK